MIRPSGFPYTLVCAAGILLAGRALAQQQSQAARIPAPVATSAASSAAPPTSPLTASSVSNSSAQPVDAATSPARKSNPAPAGSASSSADSPAVREEGSVLIEGEKRFATNCGRCHQAPHKFPPRMMATIVRHMRVRATITDEDMRLILLYMTQ